MNDYIIINGKTYIHHHTAAARGYESRKDNGEPVGRWHEPFTGDFTNADCLVTYGRWYEHKGRFGVGYVHESPRWDTSQYIYKSYYVSKEM